MNINAEQYEMDKWFLFYLKTITQPLKIIMAKASLRLHVYNQEVKSTLNDYLIEFKS